MILEKQIVTKREILVGEESEGFDMQLSIDDMSYIMTLLSDLYKDCYSIIPQEILSNSWDATVEACSTDPIICEIKKEMTTDKWYFAAQDFGIGISPERIKIFGCYGKSSKRLSNDLIGMWGIGSKSPLCYTKTFYVDTVYNGIHYIYYISPNEEGIPRIDLLHSEDTELSNRSKVWFYLKKDEAKQYSYIREYHSEAQKFVEGAKRKTIYFNNLVYDFDITLTDLNKFKRIEGKHFVYSEAQPFPQLHILLGQVPYELDFNLLGISSISIPIAVKIESGVMPTPTREALKYSDKSIQVIKEAIQLAATELIELANKKRQDITDWKEWLNIKNESPRVQLGKDSIVISSLLQYSTTPLQTIIFKPLEGIDTSRLSKTSLFPFKCLSKISNGRRSDNKRMAYYGATSYNQYMRQEGQFQSKKNTYLSDINDSIILVLRKQTLTDNEYNDLLNLTDKEVDRQVKIDKYNTFVDSIWSTIPSYDDVVIPKDYFTKKKREAKPQGYITINVLRLQERRTGTFVTGSDAIQVNEFGKEKQLVVYGTKDDREALDAIWRVHKNIKVMYLAESNFKYLKEHHQYINVKDWHKSRVFSRVVTAHMIRKVLHKYELITKVDKHGVQNKHYKLDYCQRLEKISTQFDKGLGELYDYQEKNLRETNYNIHLHATFMASCIEVADKNKLWDYSIYYKIKQFEELCEKLKFVTIFDENKDWTDYAIQYVKKVNKQFRTIDTKYF